MHKLVARFNPNKEEWNNAFDYLGKEGNFFLNWERSELLNKIGILVLRILVFEDQKPVCIYQAEIEKRKKFVDFLNIRCGGREEGAGLLISDKCNKPEVLSFLIGNIKRKLRKDFGRFSLKYFSFYFDKKNNLFVNWNLDKKHSSVINLSSSLDELMARLNKKTRNEIRQAQKRNVKISLMNNEKGIKSFYDLSQDYWRKTGKPFWLKGNNFFEFYKENIDKNILNVFLAKIEDNPAAFAAIWKNKKNIIYFAGGMNRKYQWYRPSNLLLWEVIKWGKEKGCKFLDMGGLVTDKRNPRYSISKFKEGFGGELKEFYKYYKIFI